MKKIIKSILVLVFFITAIMPAQGIRGAILVANDSNEFESIESKVNLQISKWVLNEEDNTLYALSSSSKKILFINASTLTIEKTMSLNGNPKDILLDKDKIYVSLGDVKQLAVIDKSSRKLTETIYLSYNIGNIVKYGNTIIYEDCGSKYSDSWVREYNLDSKQESLILELAFGGVTFDLNKEDEILYIGTLGEELLYYSLKQKEVISQRNKSSVGIYSNGKVHYKNGYVFYEGLAFDKLDTNKIEAYYGVDINYIYNNLIYSNNNIYDMEHSIKLGVSITTMDLVEETENTVYIYNLLEGNIKKITNKNGNINKNNIIKAIAGNETEKIKEDSKGVKINDETYELPIKNKISEWIIDEKRNLLYAIAPENNAIIFLDAKTLDIKNTFYLKTSLGDLSIDNDKLYVSCNKLNKVKVIDLEKLQEIDTIDTKEEVNRIEVFDNIIYYVDKFGGSVREYNIRTGVETEINLLYGSGFDIEINRENKILYAANCNDSRSKLIYYDLEKGEVISQINDEELYNRKTSTRLTYNNGKVFYAGRMFDGKDAKKIIIKYPYESPLINANKDLVFAKEYMYERETGNTIGKFDYEMDLVISTDSGAIYMYNFYNGKILKVQLDLDAPIVEGVVDGGIYGNAVKITFNEGTATLNGIEFISGGVVSGKGKYILEVIDNVGNTTKISFEIEEYSIEDLNKDGITDILDLGLVATTYNKSNEDIGWKLEYDFNKDGIIDIYDLISVSKKIS